MTRACAGNNTYSTYCSVGSAWFLGMVSGCFVLYFLTLIMIKNMYNGAFSQMAVYVLFFSAVPVFTGWSIYSADKHVRLNAVSDRLIRYLGYFLPLAVLLYGLVG